MVQVTGDALEWALALAKAPAERVALRQRPLPAGMQRLLQIAGDGANEAVAELAAQTGEAPADIVEAARFYAREILFHQPADAYRVLGVSHLDDQDTLRSHHRLLQQWLHPDRQTSDWDAIFASRVNAAWNQLRTPERRLAYDQANPPRPQDSLPLTRARPHAVPSVLREGMVAPHAPDPDRWRRRAPVLVLAVVCAALGLLAVRDMQRSPEEGRYAGRAVASAEAAPEALPRLQAPATVAAPHAGRPRVARTSPTPAIKSEPIAEVRRAPVLAGAEAAVKPAPVAVEASVARMRSVPAASPPVRTPPAPAQRPPLAAPTQRVPDAVAVAEPAPASATPVAAAPVAQPVAMPERKSDSAPTVSLQRVQQAQQVGGRLIAFLTAPNAASPPIWNSPAAQSGAAQVRDGLQGEGGLQISDVNWRVGESIAALRAGIRYSEGRKGRLSADLVWRDQRWLVTGLSVERDL